jgi:DNA modification methylase
MIYYSDNLTTLFLGDCRELMPTLCDYDLLLTDPPYGIGAGRDVCRHGFKPKEWDDEAPQELVELSIKKASKSIVWGGNYFRLPTSRNWLVWDKQQPQQFSLAQVELAWASWDGNAKMYASRASANKKFHPTQKPVGLMRWCIGLAGASTVLDTFAGSGTTLVAAKLEGIPSAGIEKDEEYCEIAAKRLEQKTLF